MCISWTEMISWCVKISSESGILAVMREKHSRVYEGGTERVIIVLKGEAHINGERCSPLEFIVSDEGLTVEQEDGALSIVVHHP